MNRKVLISLFLGLVFSGVAIAVSFRNIPVTELFDYIGTINFWWIVPSTALGLFTYFIRALRWQVILNPVKRIGFWHAFHPLVIAFAINCILPGRLGELARPAILYRRDRVEFSKVLATVAVERIFDMATLLLLFILLMGSVTIDPSLSISFGRYELNRATLVSIQQKSIMAGLLLLAGTLMLMVRPTRALMGRVISWLPHLLFLVPARPRRRMSERLHVRTQAILDNIAHGFEVLRTPSKILSCSLLSLGVWLVTYMAFSIFLFGCTGVDLTFLQASAAFTIMCFFIVLPSVPGYWGLWEAGGIYGLMIFGVPRMEAAGLTLTFHFFAIVPLILVGILSGWVTGVNLMQAGLHAREMVGEDASR